MSICLAVRLVRGHNKFWSSLQIETKFIGYILDIKFSCGIKIDSKNPDPDHDFDLDKNFAEPHLGWVSSIYRDFLVISKMLKKIF